MKPRLLCWLTLASSFALGPNLLAAEARFPGATWEHKSAAELGLDPARLEAVAAALGGRGCIVKDGYMVHTWGAQS
jgi:hypothetical protein